MDATSTSTTANDGHESKLSASLKVAPPDDDVHRRGDRRRLFVGSGSVIHSAGPAAVLAYLAGGILVVLIMRMLGEMATSRPTPARSPPTPTAPSAAGPASPSAGCTGGTG
jgi:GABA permease